MIIKVIETEPGFKSTEFVIALHLRKDTFSQSFSSHLAFQK